MRKILNNPLFSGSAVMIGGSLMANAVNYVYHLLMGRLLGPADYGVLASVFALLYIISIVPQSAGFAIVKFVSAAKTKKEVTDVYMSLRKFVFCLAWIMMLVVFLASPFMAKYLHIDNVFIVALVGLVLFASLITLVLQTTLQGLLVFWGQVGPTLVSSVGKLVIGLALILIGWGVFGAVLGIFLSVMLAFVYGSYLIRKQSFSKKYDQIKMRPFFVYALPVLIQALAFTSIFTVDLILVKHYLPEFDAGLYAALSTLGKIIYFAVQPISNVMFPIVSKRRAKGEAYRQVFYLSFLMAALGAGVIVGMFYLYPNLAIGILYGKDYLGATKELSWMGLFIAVYTLSYIVVSFLLSIGKTKIVLLPLVLAIAQIFLINRFHESILQVIQVSLMCVTLLFVGLGGYLGYYQISRIYAKK